MKNVKYAMTQIPYQRKMLERELSSLILEIREWQRLHLNGGITQTILELGFRIDTLVE